MSDLEQMARIRETSSLCTTYVFMLQVPFNSPWRIQNQAAYGAIVGRLAELFNVDAETIQTTFEAKVCFPRTAA